MQPGEEYRLGDCDTSGNIMGHYRPLGNGPTSIDDYDTLCTPAITSGCEVGDLTGKHDQLTIQGKYCNLQVGCQNACSKEH